jgi:sensor domain CHASE-containing protein
MELSWGWIVLGLVIWALGAVFVFALFSMARDQDRAARHEEHRLVPYSDVTITRISG